MIDRRRFAAWWQRLEGRLGKADGADAYLLYLESQGMETEAFEAAASAVWATSRFFPRPADFLLVEAGSAWDTVRIVAPELLRLFGDAEAWRAIRQKIPDRAWRALSSLGGPTALRDSTDLVRFRREFLDAYELAVIDSARGSLEIGAGGKLLAITERATA